MTDTTAWPFGTDADQHDPLTALRIPVTGTHPRFRYIATFDHDSQTRPTDLEALQLASYIEEYKVYYFGADSAYKRKLEKLPLDADAVTRIFHKWAEDDWSYRVDTWQYGPFWVPVFPAQRGGKYDDTKGLGPLTLVQVMDRAHTIVDDKPMQHWIDWKAQHPEVFPA